MPILLTGIKKNNIHLFLAKLEMGWFMPVKIFTFESTFSKIFFKGFDVNYIYEIIHYGSILF